jgi:GNAT superfamily N-acetyltransferase
MIPTITEERPDSPAAAALILELESVLEPLYPQTSRHGYSIDKLLREGVAFCVARQNGEPAGCGGVQLFGAEYGEVKRMYVRPAFRGQGAARALLDYLADYCRQRGVTLLRLETGIYQVEAIRLYERYGFQRIAPFGPYHVDPLSLCYEMQI